MAIANNLEQIKALFDGDLESSDDEDLSSEQSTMDCKEFEKILRMCALNEVYLDFLENLIEKVDDAIDRNRQLQEDVRKGSLVELETYRRSFCGLFPALAPYFKSTNDMMPTWNSEAWKLANICDVDPLMKESRHWKVDETVFLKDCVKRSLIVNETLPLRVKKDMLIEKLNKSGAETSAKQKSECCTQMSAIDRRINFLESRTDSQVLEGRNYDDVDWAKISVTDFRNTRSIDELRKKWCNELSPEFSKNNWTEEEDDYLAGLAERKLVDWDFVAVRLRTSRSPFQCFQRFTALQNRAVVAKPWDSEEDEILLSHIRSNNVRGEINWRKVGSEMPGRDHNQCKRHYHRSSLVKQMKTGRWSIDEDLILFKAINKFGPQSWPKVADVVGNRTSLACRDRWINVLDPKRRNKPWLWEEHMRLLMGVKYFGRASFAKIALLLPGRNNLDVKNRINALIKHRIQAYEAQLDKRVYTGYSVYRPVFVFFEKRREEVMKQIKLGDQPILPDANVRQGPFMLTSSGDNIDYSIVKIEQGAEFGNRSAKSGRWYKVSKNPNEYGSEELDAAMQKLPKNKREKLLIFLKASDVRYAQQLKAEEECPKNEIVNFYESIITLERMVELNQAIDKVLKIEAADIAYHIKKRKRQLKIYDDEDADESMEDEEMDSKRERKPSSKNASLRSYDYSGLLG